MSWKDEQKGPQWVPVLNYAETELGIPTDLLARIAYQESRFREDIIRGTDASPVGALGMMQLRPRFWPQVCRPLPFTDSDVGDQIEAAANFLVSLHKATGSWELAIAGYNAGLGNVQRYGGVPPFSETQNYVAQVMADVPGLV